MSEDDWPSVNALPTLRQPTHKTEHRQHTQHTHNTQHTQHSQSTITSMLDQRKHYNISPIIKHPNISVTNQDRNPKHRALSGETSSPHWGLNPGPSVYRTDALPLSYKGHAIIHSTFAKFRQMPYTLSGTIYSTWPVLPGPHSDNRRCLSYTSVIT